MRPCDAEPGPSSSVQQGFRPIGDHLCGIEIELAAQSVALRTSAVHAVEGERPRLQYGHVDAAIGAGQLGGVHALLAADHGHLHQPVGHLHRQLNRAGQPPLDSRPHQQAVHHQLDGVVLALVKLNIFIRNLPQLAVDAGAGVSLLHQAVKLLAEFALASAHDGRHHHHAVFRLQGDHLLHDLLGRLARDGAPALRAMRHPDGGVEQPQIVVNFGDGADGRARAAAGGLLLDGDRRAQAVDAVHVGPLHLVEELAGVSGKRLDVAPLALGVDGVERQRRFSRTAEAGDDGERVARNLDADVLQIVLTRPAHGDAG